MGLILDYGHGQTPLDEDEKEGIRIPTIATRGELDEFEQQNIEAAILWTLTKKFKLETILTEKFIQQLHYKMYNQVWAWAGKFRKTNKNIGVDKWMVSSELKQLLDDVKFWCEHQIYSPDEITIRFKHRLVSIHCFPNGNGRHSRLIADILIEKVFNLPIFSWGANLYSESTEARSAYIKALRSADAGDYSLLSIFARS